MAAFDSRVTIVIATRNRRAKLLQTVRQLRSLPEKPRIIVIDNRSRDQRPLFCGEGVHFLPLSENRGAAARTIGVTMADTPYVAFCDDDSVWEPGAVPRAADILDAYPRLGLLCAKVLVGNNCTVDPVCTAMKESGMSPPEPLPGPMILGFVACGTVVRRRAYLEVGGFDEHYGVGGEEALLALNLIQRGWYSTYFEGVAAHHYPERDGSRTARSIVMQRNGLWSRWLKLSLPALSKYTLRHIFRSFHSRSARIAIIEALKGIPWVLRERDPLPAPIQEQFLNNMRESGK